MFALNSTESVPRSVAVADGDRIVISCDSNGIKEERTWSLNEKGELVQVRVHNKFICILPYKYLNQSVVCLDCVTSSHAEIVPEREEHCGEEGLQESLDSRALSAFHNYNTF